MAKKRRAKHQSVAAIAKKLGIPRASAKQVAVHVLKIHNMYTKKRTQTRKARHAAALSEFKGELAKLKAHIQTLEKKFGKTVKKVTFHNADDPGTKPDSGRP